MISNTDTEIKGQTVIDRIHELMAIQNPLLEAIHDSKKSRETLNALQAWNDSADGMELFALLDLTEQCEKKIKNWPYEELIIDDTCPVKPLIAFAGQAYRKKTYYDYQIDGLQIDPKSYYSPSIQICGGNGNLTNYMNITPDQVEQIRKILNDNVIQE